MFKHLLQKNMCRCKAYSLVHLHWSNMRSFHTRSTLHWGHMWEMYPMCVKMTSSASSTCIQVKEFGFRGHQTDASQWQSLGLVHPTARHTDSFKHYYTGFAPTGQAPCQVYRLWLFAKYILQTARNIHNSDHPQCQWPDKLWTFWKCYWTLFFMRIWSMLDSFLLKTVAPFGSHV